MSSARAFLRATLLLLLFVCFARADNCGSLGDCYNTLRAALAALVGIGTIAMLLSLGLDFLPVIGSIKMGIEGIVGKDLITGEELENWQRTLGLIPFAGPLGKLATVVEDAAAGAAQIARVAQEAEEGVALDKALAQLAKNERAGYGAAEGAVGHGLAGSIRNVNPTGGALNCINCAIATDATLAGRAASALPGGATSISVLEQQFGGQFVKVSGQQAIEITMQAAGSDARAIVYGERAGGIGHVFNVVNQSGVLRVLDGQTGRVASFAGYTGFRLLRTN